MVVLALLYLCSFKYTVWAQDDVVSNALDTSAVDQKYGKLESAELDAFDWRIWGGACIGITQAPYTVLYGWSCGGTLIATNWVLTAAHCRKDDFIHVGSEIRGYTSPYAIRRHIYHPGWFPPKFNYHDYDFLLLELAEPVPITCYTRPIALGKYEDYYAGQPVVITGWGHTEYKFNISRDETWPTETLRQATMSLVNFEECGMCLLPYYNSKYHEFADITGSMACAQGDRQGVCFGDSGGPVVANSRLVGVVSWVVHCEPLLMFANVYMVRDWIQAITGL